MASRWLRKSETIVDGGGDVKRLVGRHPVPEVNWVHKTDCEKVPGVHTGVGTTENRDQPFVQSPYFSVSNDRLSF